MIPMNPTNDLPSCESEKCDIGPCAHDWAWEAEIHNGARRLRLCELHADEWLRGERELAAEREELSGRELVIRESLANASLFGLARTFIDGRSASDRRRPA
jgi:hypothetical protein